MQQQRICTADGCERPHLARGLCRKHYRRWQRTQPQDRERDREYEARRRQTPERLEQERRRNARRGDYSKEWQRRRAMPSWALYWERRRLKEDLEDIATPRLAVSRGRCLLSQRPKVRLFIGRNCKACRASWVSYAAMPDTDYCSPCNDKRWKADGRHKRRAWKAAAAVREVISPGEVFRRDGYRCQLCGSKTQGVFPHPRSPTVDHIVPLADGGDHSYLNVQCACFSCNCRKGTSAVNDQLRLIA